MVSSSVFCKEFHICAVKMLLVGFWLASYDTLFLLPDNNRQYFSLSTSAGMPLRMVSARASATLPIIDIGDYTLSRRGEIRSVALYWQASHVMVAIYLYVNATEVEVTMNYRASMLAGPAPSIA